MAVEAQVTRRAGSAVIDRALPIVLVALAALLSVLVVVRFDAPLYTLESNSYTDHVRHEYTAWSSLKIGTRVYSDPLEEWGDTARHPHPRWETLPHAYPPGSLLLFLPFGVLANAGLVPDEIVHVMSVSVMGLGGMLCLLLLWFALRPKWPAALAGAVVVLAAPEVARWAFNGLFDALAIAVCLGAFVLSQRGRTGAALVVLAAGLSLHFRLWFLVPFALALAWQRRRVDAPAIAAGVILALSGVAFLLLLPSFGDLPDALEFQRNPLAARPFAWLSATVVVVLIGIGERRVVPVLCACLAVAVALVNPQWQAWYHLAFLPLLAMLGSPLAQGAATVAWVQLMLIIPVTGQLGHVVRLFAYAFRF